MGKKKKSERRPGPRRRWSDRLPDGRLRVQCKNCYDAEVSPTVSPSVCLVCSTRRAQKSQEMAEFRMSLGLAGGNGAAVPANRLHLLPGYFLPPS